MFSPDQIRRIKAQAFHAREKAIGNALRAHDLTRTIQPQTTHEGENYRRKIIKQATGLKRFTPRDSISGNLIGMMQARHSEEDQGGQLAESEYRTFLTYVLNTPFIHKLVDPRRLAQFSTRVLDTRDDSDTRMYVRELSREAGELRDMISGETDPNKNMQHPPESTLGQILTYHLLLTETYKL